MENHFIGLDIGKKNVDVAVPLGTGFSCFRINNTAEGFRKLENELLKRKAELKKKKMEVNFWLVSEATGIYYIPIHVYFVEHNWDFTVVNPLSISTFRKQELKINKTDKEDCMLISKFGHAAHYAGRLKPTPAPSTENRMLTQLQVVRNVLQSKMMRLGGAEENLNFAKIEGSEAEMFLETMLTANKIKLLEVENKLISLIKALYPVEYKCMNSIKGVGPNLIIEIIIETDCLQKFKNMQAFRSYSGVVPGSHESGTSVYKKPKLAILGNRNLRKALYMSSLSASKANKECRELYERLPPTLLPKQKLMHVAKMLSKQIWYCVSNKEVYKPESQRIRREGNKVYIEAEKPKYNNARLIEEFENAVL